MTAPTPDRPPGRIALLTARISGGGDGVPTSLRELRDSETAKAVGLAAAMIANNVIALVSSIVFARLLNDYGSLAALVSYLLILTVFGQAMQVATAREAVLGHLGVGKALLATMERWTRTLMVVTLALTVVSILLRQPIADLVGVKSHAWAAAAGLPAGCMYLEVSILRGALQGIGDYKSVGLSLIGEQGSRLIGGAVLVLLGLGIGGAYLGSLLSYVAMSLYCWWRLEQRLGGTGRLPGLLSSRSELEPAIGLRRHVWGAWVAIAGLAVIQLLQNIDLITAKHQFSTNVASAYAVTAVAAKVLIWVAMGAGFYLVPEASRRRAAGEDTRPVLLGALAIVLVCAIPCLLIYAFAAHPLLSIVFGQKRAIASGSLLPLGAAFTVLAATYLAVQYMLALRRTWFLLAIGAVAVLEPILLLQAAKRPSPFALVVLLVQAIGALLAFGMALRKGSPPPPAPPPPSPRGGQDTAERERVLVLQTRAQA
jgi:O-antigen/teichoic acid export membrane protein